MYNESIMAYLGYAVRLKDGTINPTAAKADEILCMRYPQGVTLNGPMSGSAVAECWNIAKHLLEQEALNKPAQE